MGDKSALFRITEGDGLQATVLLFFLIATLIAIIYADSSELGLSLRRGVETTT